jgi:hypothetical protein
MPRMTSLERRVIDALARLRHTAPLPARARDGAKDRRRVERRAAVPIPTTRRR